MNIDHNKVTGGKPRYIQVKNMKIEETQRIQSLTRLAQELDVNDPRYYKITEIVKIAKENLQWATAWLEIMETKKIDNSIPLLQAS